MADQVNWFAAESGSNPIPKNQSPPFDPGDRGNLRDQHTITGRLEKTGNPAKIGRKGERPEADPVETEESMCHDDRRIKARTEKRGEIHGVPSRCHIPVGPIRRHD